MSDERPESTGSTGEPQGESKATGKAQAMAGSLWAKVKAKLTSPNIKSIRPLTWVGMGLGLVFFVCMFIDTINVRWWVMLPLGIAGMLIMWRQWNSTPSEQEFELKVTFFGLVAIVALLALRDAWLSSSLAAIHDKAQESGEVLKQFEKLIGN